MAETDLLPRPALAGVLVPGPHGAPGAAGVRVGPLAAWTVATLSARRGREAALRAAVANRCGTDLPMRPRFARGQMDGFELRFVWAGPATWLVIGQGEDLAPLLRTTFDAEATVSDQSDGITLLRVSGPRARDLLAKGVPIDLHPRIFAPGDAAVTTVEHVRVHLWQVDAKPTYDLGVLLTYAPALFEWLLEAGAEFGIDVVSDADP